MWSIQTSFSDSSRDVAMATNFMAKFGYTRLFSTAAFQNGLDLSPFWFKNVQRQYFCYILCKLDEDRSSNSTDYETNKCTFLNETAKSTYPTEYLSNYSTDLHQTFRIGRYIYGDYKTDISCAVGQETFPWESINFCGFFADVKINHFHCLLWRF